MDGFSLKGLELAVTIPYSFGLGQIFGLPGIIYNLFDAAINQASSDPKGHERAKESLSYAGFFALTMLLPIVGAIAAYKLHLGPSYR